VTEIPEHLLKRSKERRSAIGGGDAADDQSTPPGEAVEAAPPTAAVPAAAAVAVPEPAPTPTPVRPEVAAALSRRKIPFWAMPVLAGLPLWAYVYQATLEPAPTGELTPIEAGAAVYASAGCSGCHGPGGAGNGGVPGFAGVLETWPDYRDHMMWLRLGNAGWYETSGTKVYGANQKPSNGGVMPAFPTLSDQELAEVTLYERVTFGGMEESGPEYEALLAIAEGSSTFADAGLGELSAQIGVTADKLTAG